MFSLRMNSWVWIAGAVGAFAFAVNLKSTQLGSLATGQRSLVMQPQLDACNLQRAVFRSHTFASLP